CARDTGFYYGSGYGYALDPW
nr:immunoglobulin heavy chain junction region [Macaca mulatta]